MAHETNSAGICEHLILFVFKENVVKKFDFIKKSIFHLLCVLALLFFFKLWKNNAVYR